MYCSVLNACSACLAGSYAAIVHNALNKLQHTLQHMLQHTLQHMFQHTLQHTLYSFTIHNDCSLILRIFMSRFDLVYYMSGRLNDVEQICKSQPIVAVTV